MSHVVDELNKRAADLYSAAATADLTLTTTAQIPTGCSVTVPRGGNYLVIGTFDFNITAAGPVASIGQPDVNGALPTGGSNQAILGDAAVRGTVTQAWVLALQPGDVLALKAFKAVNAGTSKALQPHTNLHAIRLS